MVLVLRGYTSHPRVREGSRSSAEGMVQERRSQVPLGSDPRGQAWEGPGAYLVPSVSSSTSSRPPSGTCPSASLPCAHPSHPRASSPHPPSLSFRRGSWLLASATPIHRAELGFASAEVSVVLREGCLLQSHPACPGRGTDGCAFINSSPTPPRMPAPQPSFPGPGEAPPEGWQPSWAWVETSAWLSLPCGSPSHSLAPATSRSDARDVRVGVPGGQRGVCMCVCCEGPGSGQERVCREGGERRRGEDARAWSGEPRGPGH